jgi:hypothetical protein
MASLNGRVVLFGGHALDATGANVEMSDTWEWDGNTWSQRLVAGPSARSGAGMATR